MVFSKIERDRLAFNIPIGLDIQCRAPECQDWGTERLTLRFALLIGFSDVVVPILTHVHEVARL